ncbi:hypothetical protein FSP39_015921 [Pinctada imbricata]|uniref:Phospholipase A-2-activating protein n=1 Tax=Pinctada imbricata TaxID=66713 RepID=A0AA89BX98_PINIB|nr:hypothetical protein FSP39_015921 [Pinctada imbricata]
MAAPYKFRCNIVGHEKDVRTVCPAFVPNNGIISGSRDVTARVWAPNESNEGFTEGLLMRGHNNFISAVCVMPPDTVFEHGLIMTGSNDNTILAYTPESPQPVYKLEGHEANVCALAAGKFGTLLSGSWDKTAKVWLNQKCVMTLKGHESAVWGVGIMPEHGYMLTGSADRTIKLWKAGKCERTFTGHEDCVRGIAVIGSGEFLSCSNDSSVRRWSITGDCLAVHYGHENFVYSIAMLPNGEDFVSSGEDRTVRVWRGGKCVQTIAHPAQSVWAVCVLPNGDIVTGSSDGVIRVFTTSPNRTAPEEEQKAYEEQVSSTAVPTQLGDIKSEDLPGPEVLNNPGTKDGQQKIVRQGNNIELYQWDSTQREWKKIGDVVGSSGGTQQTSGKTLHEGKEYDYVFSVDIEEGKPPLKLPFNVTEDPWFAAQKFLEKNGLSQLFLDQVANFIVENTKGVTLGRQNPQYADPFTGGNRHVPGSDNLHNGGTGDDPFTGGGRYIPGSGDQPAQPSFGADPFTGSSSYSTQAATQPLPTNNYFPQKTYVLFESGNPAPIIDKLKEFNGKVDSGIQLSDTQLDGIHKMLEGTTVTEESMNTLLEVLYRWPPEYIFPGLDVLRITIRNPKVCQKFCNVEDFLERQLGYLTNDTPAPAQMLTLRTFCNMFKQPSGEKILVANRDRVITPSLNCRLTQNKNIQIALCTLLLNYSVYLQNKVDEEAKSQCLLAIASVLENPLDSEAQFRLLVSLGTLMSSDDGVRALAQSLEIENLVSPLQNMVEPKKLPDCASYILKLLR